MLTSSLLSQYPPLSHVAGLGMYLPFSLRHWSLLFLAVDGLHDGLVQLGRRLDLVPRLEGVLLADFLRVGVPELVKPELDG